MNTLAACWQPASPACLFFPCRGRVHFCEEPSQVSAAGIDYRGLNSIIVKNQYPLFLKFELFQGANIFSKMYVWNAYHLVCIREGDEWKTTFNNQVGHYKNLVNYVLRDMLTLCLSTLITSSSSQGTLKNTPGTCGWFFSSSWSTWLFVKVEKLESHSLCVTYLGYIIAKGVGSIKIKPEKVSAVLDWLAPDCWQKLQRFLGFVTAPWLSLSPASQAPSCHLSGLQKRTLLFGISSSGFTLYPILPLPDLCCSSLWS